ncbi:hypothetical protein HY636_03305 [Candidatus Woesearchaeota archaeon]|nr:hypothetical protein [Candidatus Woesearchaeota archaeon]
MAKILYALSGEGFGHATRSCAIIKRLSKIKSQSQPHKIKIVCGGKAHFYLSKHFNDVEKIQSLHINYFNNKVSGIGTFFLNLFTLPQQISSYLKIKRLIKEFKPDVIINDFEHLSAYAAFFNKIPLISIGNHNVISNAHICIPLKYLWESIKSKLVITFVIPSSNYYFITTFFKPAIKNRFLKNTEYLPIIIRDEIKAIKPIKSINQIKTIKQQSNDYILVYQTSKTNNSLLNLLKRFDKKFVVYGFNVDKTDGNILFKSFKEKEFYKDMANCSAVIINGGFSLMSEAIYLKKPVYSEPVKHQFEQILNAIYLQKLGYGMFAETSSKESLLAFFSKLDEYKKNLNSLGTKKLDNDFDKAIVKINENILFLTNNIIS